MSVIRFPVERTRAYREQAIRSMDDLPAVDPTFNLADVLGPVEVNDPHSIAAQAAARADEARAVSRGQASALLERATVIWLEEMGYWS